MYRFYFFSVLKREVSVEAAETTSLALEAVDEEIILPRASVAADLAALLAAVFADVCNEERSSPESLVRLLSTVEELLLFTSLPEPEISPFTKLVVLVFDFRPLMLLARVTMFTMFVGLVRSRLPLLLYWV